MNKTIYKQMEPNQHISETFYKVFRSETTKNKHSFFMFLKINNNEVF